MRVPLAAVAATLALRIVYFVEIRESPFFDTPLMDEAYHDGWAREIAEGRLTERAPFFRAPLYPFLLGAAYRVFGPNYSLIRALQLVLGAVTPVLAWLLARALLPRRPLAAGVAAFVVALDAILVYFEADLLLESMLAPLGTLFALVLVRALDRPSALRWAAAGAVLGIFAVTRPNILLFAPVALGVALTRPRRVQNAAALAGAALLFVAPVAAVNRLAGDSVLIASQGGLNFFLGNNSEANGWSATAPSLFRIDWWGGYEDAIRIAEEAEGKTLRPSEVSAYWFDQARQWWRENPRDAIALTAKKVVYFFSGEEFGNNRHTGLFLKEYAPFARPSLFLLFVVMPLAALGGAALWRRGDMGARVVVLFALVYALSVIVFFVTSRYRVPLRALFAILACEGVFVLLDLFRKSKLRGGLTLAALVAAGLAWNRNPWIEAYEPSKAQFYQSVANIHHEKGRLKEALESQRRALELDSTYPKGNLNLGTLYMDLGDVRAAIPAFERERMLDPEDGKNLASLARAYSRAGRLEDAERAYAAAEARGLADPPALYNHGVVLDRLERIEEAEMLYRSALAVDSTFADAWNNLGVLEARRGRLEAAIDCWSKVLEIHPLDDRAKDNIERARRQLGS
jgi:4-amino-4-deoxy-L-arabinose transferase-like glycosyltransferase